MLNVLILEDEAYTLRYFQAIVSEHPLVAKVTGTRVGRDAVQLAQKHLPDVALLDIELAPEDDYTGLEVATYIARVSPATKFVFVTGYAKYALDSFTVHPYDYVLKPICKNRIFDVLTELARQTDQTSQNRPKRIIVQNAQEKMYLAPSEIFFFEKQGRKTLVHTQNGIYELAQSLNTTGKSLPPDFLRTHKSFIININKIKRLRNLGNRAWEVYFHGYDKSALLSRYKYEEYKELFSSSIK